MNTISVRIRDKLKTFSVGNKVFKVSSNINMGIFTLSSAKEGTIVKIGSTMVTLDFEGCEIKMDLQLTKSYKPNERFKSSAERILDEETYLTELAMSDANKHATKTINDFKNLISSRHSFSPSILAKNPKIEELIVQLTSEISKDN